MSGICVNNVQQDQSWAQFHDYCCLIYFQERSHLCLSQNTCSNNLKKNLPLYPPPFSSCPPPPPPLPHHSSTRPFSHLATTENKSVAHGQAHYDSSRPSVNMSKRENKTQFQQHGASAACRRTLGHLPCQTEGVRSRV